MSEAKATGVRLRQMVAGLAIVLGVSPGVSAQSLFDPNPSTGPALSRPFRVSFDAPRASETLPGDVGRWSLSSNIEASAFQMQPFNPPRRRYPGKSGSGAIKSAQKVTAAVALGLVGTLAGALAGAAITRDCDCGDDAMLGPLIGAPIGAAVGAIVGYRLVK